ncbi:hypothetical protein WAI453_002511 [Rhynchosporium graminicola]
MHLLGRIISRSQQGGTLYCLSHFSCTKPRPQAPQRTSIHSAHYYESKRLLRTFLAFYFLVLFILVLRVSGERVVILCPAQPDSYHSGFWDSDSDSDSDADADSDPDSDPDSDSAKKALARY